MKEIVGKLVVDGQRFGIVVARFNEFITSKLLGGAVDTLVRHGCKEDAITVVHVPGTFEIPAAAMKMAKTNNYDAIICLGCLLRGETSHFDYICSEVTRGVGRVGVDTSVPAAFGVITAESLEQAVHRAGAKAGNKGAEAATAAIEMANLLPQIS